MISLPIAMVNSAATAETSADALKIEALRYAATNADIGMDVFRTHYLSLLSGKAQSDARIVEAAIWGGMLRSDPDATRAISVAISNTPVPKYRTTLLRLAALTGAAEYLPLLLHAAESDPATGYPLLVLYGQKSVMPELLKALEVAHTMEHAAAAFRQLTDQILPRIPRLTVVGEEEDDAEENAPQIPDIKAARAWWDKHQSNWKADERWLFGKPANTAHLVALIQKHAGRFGQDIMALLELSQKAPLNIPSEIWRARQQQLLADKMAAQPASKPVLSAKSHHA
jgi:predicted secreted protein